MGKRDELKRLTASWAGRTWASGKAAAHLGRAAAQRAMGSTGGQEGAGAAITEHLDQLKGLAMKAGQMASYLEGTLPPEAQTVLRKLQQGGQPMAFEVVRAQVEQALGAPLSELFDTLDEEPLAAASIGQVHTARLGDHAVAVKVQYPEITKTFEVDLGNVDRMSVFATLGTAMDRHELVGELRERLREECDYRLEAANQEQFRQLWADTPWVHIPRVFPERTATTVLTTELVEAQPFYVFREQAPQQTKNVAGLRIFELAFRGIFEHCAFNADPHPGNTLFPDGDDPGDPAIVALDFGCVRRFDPTFVETWKRLAWVVLEGRRADLRDAMVDTGMVPDPDRYDFDHHWEVMRYLYEPFLVPRFRYTHEYVKRSWQVIVTGNPNLRKSAMPREWVFTNRLQWGLNSVLALLGAEGDFATVYRRCLERPITPAPRPERIGRVPPEAP